MTRHLAISVATCDVAEATEDILASADTSGVATYLVALRDLRQDVAGHMADVERHLIALMGPERRLEIPGAGVFERHRKTRRSAWDYDELVRDVLRYGWDGGDPPEAAYAAADLLRRHLSLSGGKVTALRALGMQPDEYCTETPDGQSVELPARDHGQDAA